MAYTYQLIASYKLTSTTASVTFGSIPQTYTDLEVRISARGDFADTNENVIARLNGTSTASYQNGQLSYYSSAINYNTSFNGTYFNNGPYIAGANLPANVFGMDSFYLPDYTNSTTYKAVKGFTALTKDTGTGWAVDWHGGLGNSAAVTSITLAPYSGNYLSGSNFYLFGIKNS